MFDTLILPLILFIGGFYFLARNIRLLTNQDALRRYIETSPSAWMWRQKYGIEGAMKLAKEASVPLGLLIACGMIGLGGWLLWKLYGQ